VFENRGIRRIFESKRDDITGQRGKQNSEDPSDLYITPNIFLVIKYQTKKKDWGGIHVHYAGEERYIQGFDGEFKVKVSTWYSQTFIKE
jgi:hypothetical protein